MNEVARSLGAPTAVQPEILKVALDHVTDAVAVFDREWNILYMNAAGATLMGGTSDSLAGRNYFDVFPDAAGTSWHTFLLRARDSEGPASYRGYFERIDRFFTATVRPLGDGVVHLSFRQDPPRATEVNDNMGRKRPDEVGERSRLRYLAEVSETLSKSLTAVEAAERLTDLVVPRLADWALVTLLDEQGRPAEQVWRHHDSAAQADLDLFMDGRRPSTSGERPFAQALRTGQPVHVADFRSIEGPDLTPTDDVRAAARRLDTRSLTVVPLQAHGRPVGVVALMMTGDRAPHTDAEVAEATEVARRAAVPLDNARLHAKHATLVETLQRSLLTDPPPIPGVDIAVQYHPASSFQGVGGDWYDVISHADGGCTLVIGDVVGHNVEAAAAMSHIRSVVRTVACDWSASPATCLSRVDRVLSRLQDTTMATVLLARIEPAGPGQQAPASSGTRTLHWSSAGHPPPVLVHSDGSVMILDGPTDLLLGTDLVAVGAPEDRSTHLVDLEPGDTVLLYTDGLIEIDHTDIDTGLDRLACALGPLASLGPDALCTQLLDEVAQGPTEDDIAVLALRITAA